MLGLLLMGGGAVLLNNLFYVVACEKYHPNRTTRVLQVPRELSDTNWVPQNP